MNKIRKPFQPTDFGISPEYAQAAKNYSEAVIADFLQQTKTEVAGRAEFYAKGKADGRKEAMRDIRELLGIEQ